MEKNIFVLILVEKIKESFQVIDTAMNSSVGNKSDEVHLLVFLPCRFKGGDQDRIIMYLCCCKSFVDLHQHLVHHPPGSNIHMSYFAVAHLPFRQTYRFAKSGQGAVRS